MTTSRSSAFEWNLSSLQTGDALERAIDVRAEHVKLRRSEFEPRATGGVAVETSDSAAQAEEPLASLVVSTMMAIKACCMQPQNGNYWIWNLGTRFMYIGAFVLSIAVAASVLVAPEWFDLEVMDWFAYTSWSIVVLSEALFFAIRTHGRLQYRGGEPRRKQIGAQELVEAFAERVAFGASWQAFVVTVVNFFASGLFVVGLLVVHMQMMVNPEDPTHKHTVSTDYGDAWTAAWTVVYCYIVLSLCLAALVDPSRLGELEVITSWSVELAAWRIVLLGLVMPIIGTGFAVYANVCCDGPWILT